MSPQTPTGKRLLEEWFPGGGDGFDSDHLLAFTHDLAAIEAEAIAIGVRGFKTSEEYLTSLDDALEQGEASERERLRALRQQIRAAISNAYYDTRSMGQTMEVAADEAADGVLALLAEPSDD